MKVWKRCAAALLAFIMWSTSATASLAAGTYDTTTNVWSATPAEIVAEYYGLSEKETKVLTNGAILQGTGYEAMAPYSDASEEENALVAVDYLNRIVYAKAYETEGYTWMPETVVLTAEGEEQERFALTEGYYFYNNIEYNASSQTFTYEGNSYTVSVIYRLYVTMDLAEQNRLLAIPEMLGQAVINLETTLKGARTSLLNFGKMLPALKKMIDYQIPVTDTETGETSYEPAFDAEEDAELIAAVNSLYNEYLKNPEEPGLDLYFLCEEYISCGTARLAFALEKGQMVKEESAVLNELLTILYESNSLFRVQKKMLTLDTELYQEVRYLSQHLQRVLKATASLMDAENWALLEDGVKESIFKETYSDADFAELETAVYALRSTSFTEAEAQSTTLLAAQMEVTCSITTYQVVPIISAKVAAEAGTDTELKELSSYQGDPIVLLAGTTPSEVRAAVAASGLESSALENWNALDGDYRISQAYYTRTETELTKDLNQDILEYRISYEPNYYRIKTNFVGNDDYPYGYQLELPENTEDGWYDYTVEYADGGKEIYNQGVVYTVTGDAEITRTTGTAKLEYRVLDYLAEDTQYAFGNEAKKILLSTALESPTLKIRVPDGDSVSEIVDTGNGYYIEAESFPSGITGMVWEPYAVLLIDGDTQVAEIAFADGTASWSTAAFTHANVMYRLNITKVKNGILNRPLEEEEILEYVNLPHTLVQEVTAQEEALSGEEGVTAKTVYKNMKAYESFMSLLPSLKGVMQTTEGKNAIIRIQCSEDSIAKSAKGEALGYGGWSSTSDEPAIFKYLKLCEDADWSVATYYKMGYYENLALQAQLMAECLDAVIQDPGCTELLETFGMLEQKERIEELVPELEELASQLKGPNAALKVNDAKFSTLIEDILAAEGKTQAYTSATSICAYSSVRRNDANVGAVTVTVQVGNFAKTDTLGYALDEISGTEKCHTLTESEAVSLQNMIEELKDSCGWDETKTNYYDLSATAIPAAGDLVRRSESVTLVYTPKTYTVTIDGVSTSEYLATFQYGSDYVISLPAKSEKTTAKTYYRYSFPDENGEIKDMRAVENGTTGSYSFTEADLTTLFTAGSYVIYREELKTTGDPEVTLKPTLTTALIRGAEVSKKKSLLFLDVRPEGISKAELLENLTIKVENASLVKLQILTPAELEIGETELVGNDSRIVLVLEDAFGKESTVEYTLVLMGDVNGDGLITDADVSITMASYFIDEDAGDVPLSGATALAANMNNNKRIDSNDAWKIRSKMLYWNGDKKQSQIVYKSVLK